MKNREKYKNELMNFIKMDGRMCGFVKKHEVFRMIGKDLESYCEIDCVACGTELHIWLEEEYIEPPKPEVDWSKVPVDTLVRVRDSEDEDWTPQYFKGVSETIPTHKFEAWDDGRTSKTANNSYRLYKYCELVEDEDNDK